MNKETNKWIQLWIDQVVQDFIESCAKTWIIVLFLWQILDIMSFAGQPPAGRPTEQPTNQQMTEQNDQPTDRSTKQPTNQTNEWRNKQINKQINDFIIHISYIFGFAWTKRLVQGRFCWLLTALSSIFQVYPLFMLV